MRNTRTDARKNGQSGPIRRPCRVAAAGARQGPKSRGADRRRATQARPGDAFTIRDHQRAWLGKSGAISYHARFLSATDATGRGNAFARVSSLQGPQGPIGRVTIKSETEAATAGARCDRSTRPRPTSRIVAKSCQSTSGALNWQPVSLGCKPTRFARSTAGTDRRTVALAGIPCQHTRMLPTQGRPSSDGGVGTPLPLVRRLRVSADRLWRGPERDGRARGHCRSVDIGPLGAEPAVDRFHVQLIA